MTMAQTAPDKLPDSSFVVNSKLMLTLARIESQNNQQRKWVQLRGLERFSWS